MAYTGMETPTYNKFESPVNATIPPKQLDEWDLRLAAESKNTFSVTPTTAGSPASAPASNQHPGARNNTHQQGFKPLRNTTTSPLPPTHTASNNGGGDNPMELLSMALHSSPGTLKQVKHEIARIVLARSGSTAKPTEEEVNLIVDMLAKELSATSSVTPPDGRNTIESEIQWSDAKQDTQTGRDGGVISDRDMSLRPNAPVADAPQVVREVPFVSSSAHPTVGSNMSGRVYSSDSSSTGTVPIHPKVQVLKHVNHELVMSLKRRGGLGARSSRSAFSEADSQGSFGSFTGSSISNNYKAV